MLTEVNLYGHLAEKYGNRHVFDVNSAPEATRALSANFKGFYRDFREGCYEVKIGDDLLTTETLSCLAHGRPIHFVPVAAGNRKGGAKAIVGVALLSLATFGAASAGLPWLTGLSAVQSGIGATAIQLGSLGSLTWGNLAAFGLSMAFTGVSQLLTQAPQVQSYDNREKPDQRASFLFNGPLNRSTEGATIPPVYGRFGVGSIVLSAGIFDEQLI